MTNGTLTVESRGAGWRLPLVNSAAWPVAVLLLLLLGQFWLIFVKSFNWDEFLHFALVYKLRDGALAMPFQTLLARLLYWALYVSDALIVQMMAARIFVWLAFLVGLGAVFGLARKFVSSEDAMWTTLVYLGAGNVFVHGFAIRTDPIAMASLMLALYLLASGRLGWARVLTVGAVVGLSGLLTVKAVFYAPCFAGLAWLRISRADDKRGEVARCLCIAPVAAATFALAYTLHRAGLAPIPEFQEERATLEFTLQWLTQGLLRQPKHTLMACITAPVFVYALIKASPAWRKLDLHRDTKIALVGLCLPLLTILFYRNVFPYYFVYILAPAAVAIAPAVAELRKRHGTILLAAAICAIPLYKFATEPRGPTERQKAIIDYVHREFPPGTLYLDYSGMITDYPRVVDHLTSGIGLATYKERGIPLIAQAVESGRMAFVIDNHYVISSALSGDQSGWGLPAKDVSALHHNYVHAWGRLWLAGERAIPGQTSVAIEVPADGDYVADSALTLDGKAYRRGDVVALSAGHHVVGGPRADPVILWRGRRLPTILPQSSSGALFTNF